MAISTFTFTLSYSCHYNPPPGLFPDTLYLLNTHSQSLPSPSLSSRKLPLKGRFAGDIMTGMHQKAAWGRWAEAGQAHTPGHPRLHNAPPPSP